MISYLANAKKWSISRNVNISFIFSNWRGTKIPEVLLRYFQTFSSQPGEDVIFLLSSVHFSWSGESLKPMVTGAVELCSSVSQDELISELIRLEYVTQVHLFTKFPGRSEACRTCSQQLAGHSQTQIIWRGVF